MVKIHSQVNTAKIVRKINDLQSGENDSVVAQAQCTVYNRFVCEKCGCDTGWQPQLVTAKIEKTYPSPVSNEEASIVEQEVYATLQSHIQTLELMPETQNRCPKVSYLDIKSAQCPSCKHEQSWWTVKDSATVMGCAVFAMISGVIGTLLSLLFRLEDIVGIFIFVGIIGIVMWIAGLLLSIRAKANMRKTDSQGKPAVALWVFTDQKPDHPLPD